MAPADSDPGEKGPGRLPSLHSLAVAGVTPRFLGPPSPSPSVSPSWLLALARPEMESDSGLPMRSGKAIKPPAKKRLQSFFNKLPNQKTSSSAQLCLPRICPKLRRAL